MLEDLGKIGLSLAVVYVLSQQKVYRLPGYLYLLQTIQQINEVHRNRYFSFYRTHPLYQPKGWCHNPIRNILILNHGRKLGVPFFQDKYGVGIRSEEYSFITVSNKSDLQPHTKRVNLKRLPNNYFDYIIIFNIGKEYDPLFDNQSIGVELNRLLKVGGELLLEDIYTEDQREQLSFVNKGKFLPFTYPIYKYFTQGNLGKIILEQEKLYPSYTDYLEGKISDDFILTYNTIRYTKIEI